MPSNRARAWADTRIQYSALNTGVVQLENLLLNAPTVDTLTAVRVIGDLWVMYSPNSTVVDSLSSVDLGVGVTSAEAFAAGGVSIPSPTDDTQYPPRGWLYISTQPVVQQAESTGIFVHMAHFKWDVGSMRKIDKGVLFMVIEQNDILVGGSMRIIGRVRALCLT